MFTKLDLEFLVTEIHVHSGAQSKGKMDSLSFA